MSIWASGKGPGDGIRPGYDNEPHTQLGSKISLQSNLSFIRMKDPTIAEGSPDRSIPPVGLYGQHSKSGRVSAHRTLSLMQMIKL